MIHITTFELIQEGQLVYDKETNKSGEVVHIDIGEALVKTSGDDSGVNSVFTAKVTNLVKIHPPKVTDLTGLNKLYYQVREFHELFNHPLGVGKPLTMERSVPRKVWGVEESVELLRATSSNDYEFNEAVDALIEGVEAARTKSLKEPCPNGDINRVVGQVDAIIDEIYFLVGDLVELGFEPDKLFDAVHSANLSKLFTDEKGNKHAKYRESDGKILKSPDFFAPEGKIQEEVERQLKK